MVTGSCLKQTSGIYGSEDFFKEFAVFTGFWPKYDTFFIYLGLTVLALVLGALLKAPIPLFGPIFQKF
jgi:hypothetical protein